MHGACALYAFSAPGLALARRLAQALNAQVFAPAVLLGRLGAHVPAAEATAFESLPGLMADTFSRYDRHVFVGAAGIAVRAVAPHLRGKLTDPAVAVIDQDARFAVSLVSGHVGGANALARELARLTGAAPVITTGTDVSGLPGVDELAARKGMAMGNLPAAKAVSAALLEGRPVQVYDPEGLLLEGGDAGGLLAPTSPEAWSPELPGVWCHWRTGGDFPLTFRVWPRRLHLGLGCRKGALAGEIRAHIQTVFAQARLAPQSIARVGTADIKRGDPGLCQVMQELGAEVVYFTPEALAAVEAPGQSETVRRRVGTGSVCEASALLLAGSGAAQARLIIPKAKTARVTCAVALAEAQRSGE